MSEKKTSPVCTVLMLTANMISAAFLTADNASIHLLWDISAVLVSYCILRSLTGKSRDFCAATGSIIIMLARLVRLTGIADVSADRESIMGMFIFKDEANMGDMIVCLPILASICLLNKMRKNAAEENIPLGRIIIVCLSFTALLGIIIIASPALLLIAVIIALVSANNEHRFAKVMKTSLYMFGAFMMCISGYVLITIQMSI